MHGIGAPQRMVFDEFTGLDSDTRRNSTVAPQNASQLSSACARPSWASHPSHSATAELRPGFLDDQL